MNKGMKVMLLVTLVSLGIAALWNSVPIIKNSIHYILDPTAGSLLNFNANLGLLIITAIVSLAIALVQKYTVDADEMKKIKEEQKILKEEMAKFKAHPEKMLELQKRQMAMIPKTWDLTMKPLIYTSLPIILFFRWFNDYFITNPVKFFGIMSWIWAYLILSIIFSIIFMKLLKLP